MSTTNYMELESVRSHLPRLATAVAETIQSVFPLMMRDILAKVESPIEAVFALWWHALYPLCDPGLHLKLHSQYEPTPINGRTYRADFAIWPRDLDELSAMNERGTTFRCVIVEFDGHDFHERTKDQVIARNQRDRDFQEKGYLVQHFSGTELYRDPLSVFEAVFLAASREWRAYRDEVALAPPKS